MSISYIGLGSNLNAPQKQIESAILAIGKILHTGIEEVSSFYCTKPMGYCHQPDFINAVLRIKTALSPWCLLDELQKIEHAQGRVRGEEKNGPRTIDLDILLYDQVVMEEADLTLPHPRLLERAFVLVPLNELAPQLGLPGGQTVENAFQALGKVSAAVRRL